MQYKAGKIKRRHRKIFQRNKQESGNKGTVCVRTIESEEITGKEEKCLESIVERGFAK